jgi:hypothetical protein
VTARPGYNHDDEHPWIGEWSSSYVRFLIVSGKFNAVSKGDSHVENSRVIR